MADRGYSALTKLGVGILVFHSALAIHNSWGDAGSIAFVLAADAALVLLFLCLCEFEQTQGEASRGRARDAKMMKAAAWALTTLLTAMLATRGAVLMPLAVGVLVFICLRDVDHVRGGEGGGGTNMLGQQYFALAKVGIAVLTCSTALDTYNASSARPGLGGGALVFVSYTLLVILTSLFVRAVARGGQAGEHGQW